MIVVDASAAVKWFVPEPESEASRTLLSVPDRLVAPDILPLECASALWRKQRDGEAVSGTAGRAVKLLDELGIALRPHAALLPAALALAERVRHGIYDCLYLALAEQLGIGIATFDRRLAILAGELGIPLWTPEAA